MKSRRSSSNRIRPKMTSLELAPEVRAGLEALKARDGVPMAAQVDRAVREWLKARGIDVDNVPSKPTTSKRNAAR